LSILLGYTVFLGAEFVMLRFVQRTESAPAPGAAQLMRAWWGEVVTVPKIFLWRQPFRSNAESDNLPVGDGVAPTGVVLVHGFFCNRGFWNPWMRELRAQRVPFIAVNLEPVFGSIDHYPLVIEAAVARMETVTASPVVLVGHSMGGLAIRAWLAHFNADERVRRVITIGTPHHGTWLARFGHTTNGKQMRLASPWLTRLAAKEAASRRGRFTCFFGHCDNIVFPAATGTLADAENLHVPAMAHVHMAFQAVVFNEVGRWLAPAMPETVAELRDPDTLAR
jgi:pimeloyl-ACP methyl ester carboxylesterase